MGDFFRSVLRFFSGDRSRLIFFIQKELHFGLLFHLFGRPVQLGKPVQLQRVLLYTLRQSCANSSVLP